jgi:hypothetical protein
VLNEWVNRLGASQLLQGQELTTIKVENARAPPSVSSETPVTSRPVWSFNLVSALGKPPVAVGVKP